MKQNKSSPKAPSVRLNIFFGFLIFVIVALVLLWLFQVVFFESVYKTFKINELRENAKTLSAYIDDDDLLSEKATEIAEKYSLCISVMKLPGASLKRLTDTSYNECNLYDLKAEECLTLCRYAAYEGGAQLMSVSFSPERRGYVASPYSLASSDEVHSVIYTYICRVSDNSATVLFLNSVITPVGATVNTITLILGAISVLLVVLAAVLAIFISKKIARPIVEINERAKLFADGDYNVRFNASNGYREVNELSATLNYAGEELSKVDKLRKELISNISHDLRTPLTLIQGYSEAMRDLPDECSPENIQTIIDETKRLSSIVSEMLEYSKLESGNYQPSFELIDLGASVSSAVETYRALTEKNGYHIEYNCEGNALVRADENMILRALLNLINNAITHTGSDNTVTVRQYQDGYAIRIEVTDTGPGIAPDQLDLIWERYYKADTVHKRAAMGTGLGLSIVKSIMQIHGGRYGVSSTLGEGSTFRIELPVAERIGSAEPKDL